eukprot:symbB.v1.2.019170.t1/scaffold1559.1/size111769/3
MPQEGSEPLNFGLERELTYAGHLTPAAQLVPLVKRTFASADETHIRVWGPSGDLAKFAFPSNRRHQDGTEYMTRPVLPHSASVAMGKDDDRDREDRDRERERKEKKEKKKRRSASSESAERSREHGCRVSHGVLLLQKNMTT